VGDKVRFRGHTLRLSLYPLVDKQSTYITLKENRPYTWREVVFHNWNEDLINLFVESNKRININFDRKRIWLGDYNYFKDILRKNVISLPIYSDDFLG